MLSGLKNQNRTWCGAQGFTQGVNGVFTTQLKLKIFLFLSSLLQYQSQKVTELLIVTHFILRTWRKQTSMMGRWFLIRVIHPHVSIGCRAWRGLVTRLPWWLAGSALNQRRNHRKIKELRGYSRPQNYTLLCMLACLVGCLIRRRKTTFWQWSQKQL